MSVLERRLQVLLDNDRYERLVAEATRSGRSVGANHPWRSACRIDPQDAD